MVRVLSTLIAAVPDQLDPAFSRIEELFYNAILPIVFGLLAMLFLGLGVRAGIGIATADSPEAKKKSTSRLIWLIVGMSLCFVLAFTLPYIVKYLATTFPTPSG